MIHTQIIKSHQNNSTTTTMKFKLLTQQSHEVYVGVSPNSQSILTKFDFVS